jgi:hypothetical protein
MENAASLSSIQISVHSVFLLRVFLRASCQNAGDGNPPGSSTPASVGPVKLFELKKIQSLLYYFNFNATIGAILLSKLTSSPGS